MAINDVDYWIFEDASNQMNAVFIHLSGTDSIISSETTISYTKIDDDTASNFYRDFLVSL